MKFDSLSSPKLDCAVSTASDQQRLVSASALTINALTSGLSALISLIRSSSSLTKWIINLKNCHVKDRVWMTHILALSEQIIMSLSCVILRRLLSSVRLINKLVLLHVSGASLEVAWLGTLIIVPLTPHIVIMIILQSWIALICAESIKMLPFTETVVVVNGKFVFACVDLVLVRNSWADVT